MLFPLTCFSEAYWSLSGEKSEQLLPIKAFSANERIYISPFMSLNISTDLLKQTQACHANIRQLRNNRNRVYPF